MPSLSVAFLLFVADPAPVTIYVGPMARDGFVDADRGVRFRRRHPRGVDQEEGIRNATPVM
jgi:hypothetical protein